MLARLDGIAGVAESRVDWTGRRFLVALETGAPEDEVATAVAEALGGATVLDEDDERAAVEAFRRGEAWMGAGETLRLSRHEAHVLAERHGGEAAQELGLAAPTRQELIALVERELLRAFEDVHRSNVPPEIPASPSDCASDTLEALLLEAAARIIEGSRSFLDAEQHEELEGYLERFGRPRSP